MPSTTTKQTRPAQSQATQKQTAVSQKVSEIEAPALPALERKPAPHVPETLDAITDAVAEMLTKGTSDYCLDSLSRAAISHISARGYGSQKEQWGRERIESGLKWNLQPWKTDVIATWRDNRRQSPPSVEPTTITERIRTNYREVLEARFENFLGDATPEEIRLLENILSTRDSGVSDPVAGVDEIPLGDAFEFELGRSETYIRLPRELRAKVQNYVNALRVIEESAA